MKGKVFGGVVYFPVHSKADLHGHVRLVIRTRSYLFVATALKLYNIPMPVQLWNERIWGESQSIAEIHATEKRYGEVLAVSLTEAYLSPEKYSKIPKGLKNA